MTAAKKIIEFLPHRLALAEHARMLYQATVEPNVTREDLQNPKFWEHVSRRFEPGTRLEVMTDDMQYFCELIVLDCGANWAAVKEMRYIDFAQLKIVKGDDVASGFEVAFKGPHLKWAVIRKEDNAVIKDGYKSEAEATKVMNQHVAVISR